MACDHRTTLNSNKSFESIFRDIPNETVAERWWGCDTYLITEADPVVQAKVVKILNEMEVLLDGVEKEKSQSDEVVERADELVKTLKEYNIATENYDRYISLLKRVVELLKRHTKSELEQETTPKEQ
ncbi:MAG: hypothetical protein GY854_31125 [Deltaproteobacteria bacterium]|nr:hypothetical protein [Deltaproteobacteria bacterium]